MKKTDVKAENQAAMDNLSKRMKGTKGAAVVNQLANRTKSDPDSAQFSVGDEIYIDNDVKNLFLQEFNGRETAGVICAANLATGVKGAKMLYFSALDRSVAEYSEAGQPTGNICYAKTDAVHDVYDAIHNCATDEEVWNTLKGKSLKVAAINKVTAARFRPDGTISGTRKRNVPVFTFA